MAASTRNSLGVVIMKNSSSSSSTGIGFTGLLTVVFIVLKLTDNIDWSWWWVLAPTWIPLAAVVGFLIIALFIALIIAAVE